MSQDYKEKKFEDELCAHLAANGWLYSTNSTGYDKARALFRLMRRKRTVTDINDDQDSSVGDGTPLSSRFDLMNTKVSQRRGRGRTDPLFQPFTRWRRPA